MKTSMADGIAKVEQLLAEYDSLASNNIIANESSHRPTPYPIKELKARLEKINLILRRLRKNGIAIDPRLESGVKIRMAGLKHAQKTPHRQLMDSKIMEDPELIKKIFTSDPLFPYLLASYFKDQHSKAQRQNQAIKLRAGIKNKRTLESIALVKKHVLSEYFRNATSHIIQEAHKVPELKHLSAKQLRTAITHLKSQE